MYDVRCFRTETRGGKGRYGIWIMTRPDEPTSTRGIFFHGDKNEVQPPRYSIDSLDRMEIAITHADVLKELENWPEAVEQAQTIFERHKVAA